MKKILVILGHPKPDSLCGALARQYVASAQSVGHEVRFTALGALTFDPILHQGFGGAQPLEADLQQAQQDILWAEHLVWVYPIWWGAMPALLKGFIDRTFMPGYAFKYHKSRPTWDRLLKGRTARLLVTMDSPPWYFRWVSRMPGHQQMKRTILEFCGIQPVEISSFGPVNSSSPEVRARWLAQVATLGRQAA